jgi:predicted O-methyltransferase YrrM
MGELLKQPEYTHTWFRDEIQPIWEKFLLPRKASISRYLEIGVCEAMSMVWVLENLLDDKPSGESVAIGIDPYLPARWWRQEEADEHKRRAYANLQPYDGWSLSIQKSEYALLKMCNADPTVLFDVLYVDGNHNAPEALTDMMLGWRLLRDGGLMIVDDADRRWRQGKPLVHEAIVSFETAYETLFDVLYRSQKQVCYVKRAKARGKGQKPPMMVQA